MFAIIGIVVVFGAVIAGYLMEHGNLKVLIQPAELVIIGGAAIGTVLIGNPLHILKQMAAGVAGVFGGSKFSKQVYLESLKTVYASSQVDKKKVGHLALAIQVAFQELGVFPASNTQVPVDAKDPMPFSTVQAVETAQRVAAIGKIVSRPGGSLSGAEENGDLSSLRRELQEALAGEISRQEVALRTVPDGLVISLREIGFFESGSADIKSSSQPAFNRITSLLAERNYRIRIEGHTDNVGTAAANQKLSGSRARAVMAAVIQAGIDKSRLSAKGLGQTVPIADNRTDDGRAKNRRVELVKQK